MAIARSNLTRRRFESNTIRITARFPSRVNHQSTNRLADVIVLYILNRQQCSPYWSILFPVYGTGCFTLRWQQYRPSCDFTYNRNNNINDSYRQFVMLKRLCQFRVVWVFLDAARRRSSRRCTRRHWNRFMRVSPAGSVIVTLANLVSS